MPVRGARKEEPKVDDMLIKIKHDVALIRAWAEKGCKSAGIGCIECKQPVIEAILKEQQPMMERAQTYLDDPSLLRAIIADGCDKARKTAQETMRDVREAMGLDYS